MHKWILGTFASSFMLISTHALIAAEREGECQVTFEFDSAEVDQKAVTECVKTLQLQSQDRLQIIASATPEGTEEYNETLSKRRAENLEREFKKQVPSLRIEARGVGEIPRRGLIARVVQRDRPMARVEQAGQAVGRDVRVAAIGIADAVKTGSTESLTGHWRFGPRLGRDRTRIEDKELYFAPGLEFAYVPSTMTPNLRLELGAIANIYTEVDNQRMSSFHVAPMLAYQTADGWISGVRGLAGIVYSNVSDSDLGDAGGELRLGRETTNWSAFLGIGQTRVLQRFGFDLGYKF